MCDRWEMTDALNRRIHASRIAVDAPAVDVARERRAAEGDIILTRENDYAIAVERTDDDGRATGEASRCATATAGA